MNILDLKFLSSFNKRPCMSYNKGICRYPRVFRQSKHSFFRWSFCCSSYYKSSAHAPFQQYYMGVLKSCLTNNLQDKYRFEIAVVRLRSAYTSLKCIWSFQLTSSKKVAFLFILKNKLMLSKKLNPFYMKVLTYTISNKFRNYNAMKKCEIYYS